MNPPLKNLVPIAIVQRPHGLNGELRVRPHNAETEMLATGRRVLVATSGAPAPTAKQIVGARQTDAGLLLKLEGIADRTAAEALRGAELLVERSALPEPEEGEFYAHDVIGARVEHVTGQLIGIVRSLDEYPTCDVLSVETPDGKRAEFPLVEEVIDSIDVAARLVRVKTLEGL